MTTLGKNKLVTVIKNALSDKEMDEVWNRVKNKPNLSLKDVLKKESTTKPKKVIKK